MLTSNIRVIQVEIEDALTFKFLNSIHDMHH